MRWLAAFAYLMGLFFLIEFHTADWCVDFFGVFYFWIHLLLGPFFFISSIFLLVYIFEGKRTDKDSWTTEQHSPPHEQLSYYEVDDFYSHIFAAPISWILAIASVVFFFLENLKSFTPVLFILLIVITVFCLLRDIYVLSTINKIDNKREVFITSLAGFFAHKVMVYSIGLLLFILFGLFFESAFDLFQAFKQPVIGRSVLIKPFLFFALLLGFCALSAYSIQRFEKHVYDYESPLK